MNWKAYLAEFIGTFTLIFIGVEAITYGQAGLVGVALAHGLAIAVMVSATAAISGGHLNPAVTAGVLMGGKIKTNDAVIYMIAQCAGAVAAAALLRQHLSPAQLAAATPAPGVAGGGQLFHTQTIILVEAVLTFFLVFVVYGTAVDRRAPKVGGLFIGLAVVMGILAGGPITGAALNPARHLGTALLSQDPARIHDISMYWAGPLAGGILAGLIYSRLLSEDRA